MLVLFCFPSVGGPVLETIEPGPSRECLVVPDYWVREVTRPPVVELSFPGYRPVRYEHVRLLSVRPWMIIS